MRGARESGPPALLMPAADRTRQRAILAWAAVCFFWGTTYLAIRVGVAALPPAFFAGSRFVCAGLILWAVQRARGDRNPVGREWLVLGAVGGLLLVVGNGLVVAAEQWVDSGTAALAVALMPIWMAGISAFIPGGERLSLRGVGGLVLGIAGLVILLHPAVHGAVPSPRRLPGVVLLEVACFAWAGGSLISKRSRIGVSPLMGAAVQMTVAGAALWIIALGRGEFWSLHLTASGLESILYLVVFGSLVGYACYMFALEHLPATTVSLYAYVNPVVALLAGALLLHEPLTSTRVAAGAIILAGVALAQSGVRRGRK